MKRPEEVIGLITPWINYADELEGLVAHFADLAECGTGSYIAKLEAENAKLREALTAIINNYNPPTYWCRDIAKAALLEADE